MALKPCKECGNQISDKAKTCPQCGAAQPKKTSVFTWIVLGFIVLTVLGAMFSGSDENSQNSNSSTSKSASKDKNTAGVMLFYVQNQIRQNAKDPDSVQFRNEKINNDTDVGAVACGEYNAKNSFGAYTGFKGFVAVEKTQKTYFENGPNKGEFSNYWNKYCIG